VGGEILDAALLRANLKARFVMCGSISSYNDKPQDIYGVKNMFTLVTKRIHMEVSCKFFQSFLSFLYFIFFFSFRIPSPGNRCFLS
jgi:NADPH-dependent curcumin reductase CurA